VKSRALLLVKAFRVEGAGLVRERLLGNERASDWLGRIFDLFGRSAAAAALAFSRFLFFAVTIYLFYSNPIPRWRKQEGLEPRGRLRMMIQQNPEREETLK